MSVPLHPRHLHLDPPPLASFIAAGVVSSPQLAVLDALAPRYGWADQPDLLLALALALRAPSTGHVGVDLTRLPEHIQEEGPDPEAALTWPPDRAAWAREVQANPAVGGPDEHHTPFTWQPTRQGGLLMSRRMWEEQRLLAEALEALAQATPALTVPEPQLTDLLHRVYPQRDAQEARAAARVVASRGLAVITGGPGTGKTWGLKRILAVLLHTALQRGRPLSIELAAPTGKAAVRMGEAMTEALDDLVHAELHPGVVPALEGLEPRTLHRLLGGLPHQPHRYRHGAHLALAADVVVVDEASMVDLVLMRHLAQAMRPTSRLVLLGDRDQLASVEAGTVLADMVGMPEGSSRALAGSIAHLSRSFRFEKATHVAAIAQALQAGRPQQATQLLCGGPPPATDDPRSQRVHWLPDPGDVAVLPDRVARDLARPWLAPAVQDFRHDQGQLLPPLPGYAWLLRQELSTGPCIDDPVRQRALLDALGRYRVLTAHRRGSRGVQGLNHLLAARVRSYLGRVPSQGAHWVGRPVLVTANAYEVDLRNGDVGLVLPTGPDELRVVFPVGRDEVRALPLARLPAHQAAFAMTVHKSQGSQHHRVALVLPARAGSPILTRELVYTGITRAQWTLTWLGGREVLTDALQRTIQRASGLGELLWGEGPPAVSRHRETTGNATLQSPSR